MCRCGSESKNLLEHAENCKERLCCFGAPENWGPGYDGQIRYNGRKAFQYNKTWVPMGTIAKCPFCGSDAVCIGKTSDNHWYNYCEKCGDVCQKIESLGKLWSEQCAY